MAFGWHNMAIEDDILALSSINMAQPHDLLALTLMVSIIWVRLSDNQFAI